MIFKSSQRSGAIRLADHLTNAQDNERIAILASRDLVRGDNVHRALAEMEAISKGTQCSKNLHHVMMNPAQEMQPDQWAKAWEAYEAEFGLEGQPFIEVEHHKEGRTHRHRVYDRITEQLKAVEFSHSYARSEKVARMLEHEFGHEMTVGKHNRAVMAQLRKDGLDHVADWMERGKAHEQERPVADKSHADHQIEKRTGLSKAEAEQTIRQAWDASDSGKSLKSALEQEGLMLARGNRRDFVVVDSAGAPHSLGRRVGEKAKVVKKRMADLAPDTLPDVAQAREMQLELSRQHEQAIAEREAAQEAAKQIDPAKTPLEASHAPDAPLQADIAATEKRKKKQAIKDQLAEKNRQLEALEAEQRRQAAIERQKQRQAQRKRNAARAAALKAELEQREQEGILTRTRKAVSRKLEKVADWMRGLVRRKPQQAQDKEPEPQKQAVDDAETSKQSQQQRPPEHGRKSNKLKRQIIDLEAITKEREEREKREGKEKKQAQDKQKEQDQGLQLERGRDDKSGGNNGGDDDPFKW